MADIQAPLRAERSSQFDGDRTPTISLRLQRYRSQRRAGRARGHSRRPKSSGSLDAALPALASHLSAQIRASAPGDSPRRHAPLLGLDPGERTELSRLAFELHTDRGHTDQDYQRNKISGHVGGLGD